MKSAVKNEKGRGPSSTSNEKKYLRILNSMVGLKTVIDRDFRIVFSNCQDGSGNAPREQRVRGTHCYKSVRCNSCHLERVFRNGLPEFIEKSCPSAQRERVYLFPIFDEEGTVSMVGEMPRSEITPLREMIEESLGTKEVLMAMIEAAPLAILAVDNDLKVILWNPAAERMLGWKKEEVFGKLYPLLLTCMRDEILEDFYRAQQGKICRFFETRRIRKDGTGIDIRLSTVPLKNSKGFNIGTMAIMEDISERNTARQALKESEESYRTIFNAANDAIFVLDAEDTTILDVNLKTCEMFGFEVPAVALRQSIEDMLAGYPPYTLKDFLPLISEAMNGKTQKFEWLVKHSSGRLIWVDIDMKRIVINGQRRVLAVMRDIMDRKAAEEADRRMQEKLLHADKMAAIGTLTSGVAHEINNPNNFILSNAQFLSDVWPDISKILIHYAEENGEFFLCKMPHSLASSKIPKIIDGIAEGSHRIKGIITSLKDFSRQEKTFLAQNVDVNKVIEASLTMLQSKIKKHTDFFECRLEEEIPLVKGNFRQLEQVVINLILNAIEALPARNHGVMISTSYSKVNCQVIITVSDEGEGMSEEIQKTIFDPFFTTKLDTGGTGLGLSITFTIIKKHNGTIECNSKLGEGTTFRILLPALINNN